MNVFTFLISFLCITGSYAKAQDKEVICYIAAWANDIPEKIQINLCTTYIIAFADLNLDGTITVPANIHRFLILKTPGTKLLLSIGGGNAGVRSWKAVAATSETRSKFAFECVLVSRQFGFDGIDIDWEFPDTDERDLFTYLVRDVSELFKDFGLIVTAAIGVGNWPINVKNIYDFPQLCRHVYGLMMMTYNIHMDEPWDIESGVNFNSPKSAVKGESIEYGVKLCLEKGAEKEKLFAGLPFYSRTYKLEDPEKKEIGSPFIVGFQASDPANNILAYNKYCPRLIEEDWVKNWDNTTSSPYMIKDDLWTSYEDVRSISEKAGLSIQYDLGGVMLWTIHQDDITGECGEVQPLLKSANRALGRSYQI